METNGRRHELGRFLRDRRNRVRPSDVGLPEGARRRVAGLRREEVATLAGVGVTWYTMLENGSAAGVSAATLSAIAGALQLNADEIAYLHRLAEERVVEQPQPQPGEITRGAPSERSRIERLRWKFRTTTVTGSSCKFQMRGAPLVYARRSYCSRRG